MGLHDVIADAVVVALKEITNTSKAMKEMQYRIDVLEEFFQLNVVPVEVSIPIYLRPHLKGYESILYELEKKGDERLPEMQKIFMEAINKRFIHCGTCLEEIDLGTRNFPYAQMPAGWGVKWRKTRADFECVNCDEFVCGQKSCTHYTYLVDEVTKEKSGRATRLGCVQCMGPVPEYLSD